MVLNVTQDHLDWHGGMQAYADAKARLLKMARVKIVNRDDPLTVAMVAKLDALDVRSFGRELPERVGDMGLEPARAWPGWWPPSPTISMSRRRPCAARRMRRNPCARTAA